MPGLRCEFAGCPRVGQPQPCARSTGISCSLDRMGRFGFRFTRGAHRAFRRASSLVLGPASLWRLSRTCPRLAPGRHSHSARRGPQLTPQLLAGALTCPPVQRWWGDVAVRRSCTQLWSVGPQDWGARAAQRDSETLSGRKVGAGVWPRPPGCRTRLGVGWGPGPARGPPRASGASQGWASGGQRGGGRARPAARCQSPAPPPAPAQTGFRRRLQCDWVRRSPRRPEICLEAEPFRR